MSTSMNDMFDNRVIRASAGAGKTFALSNRFLKLLASGVPCETILATTFTRMGAGEILDRIVQRLSKAALDADAANELAQQLEWPALDQARAQSLLRTMIGSLHRLQIGTLDAFFHRIAQSFSLELDLPDDWQIVDEQQIGIMHDRVIQEVLREQTVVDLLHMLNKGEAGRQVAAQIRRAVTVVYGTYLESDAAAWDQLPECKTFLSEDELNATYMMLNGIDYSHRSTNKTAEQDLERFEAGNWLEFARVSPIFSRIADGVLTYRSKPFPQAALEGYRRLIPHCRAHVIDMLTRKNKSTFGLLDEFGTRLEADKNETGDLQFDDITRRLQSFVADSQTEEFSFRLDHTVDHLLLDEFQDTSLSQWRVLKPIADRTTQVNSARSFFCVGDTKQAIYSWRGGVSEIFDLVDRELPNITPDSLNKSFRSSPVVIEMVNQVFNNLDAFTCDNDVITKEAHYWGSMYQSQSTAHEGLPGHVTLEVADDADEATKKDKRNQAALARSRNDNVLVQTVDKVRTLHEAMPDKTIGVLVRKNKTISELIFMLQQAGIPASEEGGNSITDAASVEYILSAMTLADYPSDRVACFHLSHSPLAEMFELVAENKETKGENTLQAYKISESIRSDVSRNGIGHTIEKLAVTLAPSCTPRELSRLQQLVQEAYNYEAASDNINTKLRLSRFTNHIRDVFRAREPSSANIRVMTIHQSKGLEFDIVVTPILHNKTGWASHQPDVVVGRQSPTDPINLASRFTNKEYRALLPPEFQVAFENHQRQVARDNLCLLYVALTRAIHATHVIISRSAKGRAAASDSLLLMTLLPGFKDKDRRSGLMFEAGDANWYQSLTTPPEQSTDDSNHYYLPDDAKLVDATLNDEIRSRRGVQSASPSQMEDGDLIDLSSVFRRIDNRDALTRGTMIHGCFELVKWLDAGLPTRPELVQHLKRIMPEVDDHAKFVDEFKTMRQHDGATGLLSRQTYQQEFMPQLIPSDLTMMDALSLEVFNERDFAVNLATGFMQGTIDRLVLIKEGEKIVAADVIDFKTGSADPTVIGERVTHYRPQLAAYRVAVSQFLNLPIDRIATRLLFVETGEVVTVEHDVEPESVPKTEPEPAQTEDETKSETQTRAEHTSVSEVVPKPKFNERSSPETPSKTTQRTLWDD